MMAPQTITDRAKKEGLRYISDSTKGIKRVKKGRDFVYFSSEDELIKDDNVLERIYRLVIPPAWEKVWISPSKNSHMQATGFDEKGRKQYIYHAEWTKLCQQNKFDKLASFGQNLPKIRSRVRYDLDRKDLDFKRVIATVVWLLEHTLIRVGNDEYAKENKSFGLTTLRNKHVDFKGDEVKFEFVGKSGVKHNVGVNHPKIAKNVKECFELPGHELFQYLDKEGNKQVVDSSDINEYLKDTTDDETTAKDFRTWGGTLLSAITLNNLGDYEDEKNLKEKVKHACKEVSNHLRNTVAVCRSYYIHPAVITSYSQRRLIPHFARIGRSSLEGLDRNEYRVFSLLKSSY